MHCSSARLWRESQAAVAAHAVQDSYAARRRLTLLRRAQRIKGAWRIKGADQGAARISNPQTLYSRPASTRLTSTFFPKALA